MTNRQRYATIQVVLQHTNDGSNSNTSHYTPSTTVLKAFNLLEFISNNQPVKPSFISERLGLTRTNVHRLLATLMEIGYVTKDPRKGYRLSFSVFKLGSRVPMSQDLREIAKPLMVDLGRIANENIYLTVLYGRMVIAIEEIKSNNPLSLNPDVTYTYPIHTCASGKNFLAYIPWEEAVRILTEGDMERRTANTITDVDAMRHELDEVRRRGYSTEIREFSDDLNSYSSPIFDYRGKVVANLSISGPSIRATPEKLDRLIDALLDTTRSISQQLGRRET